MWIPLDVAWPPRDTDVLVTNGTLVTVARWTQVPKWDAKHWRVPEWMLDRDYPVNRENIVAWMRMPSPPVGM